MFSPKTFSNSHVQNQFFNTKHLMENLPLPNVFCFAFDFLFCEFFKCKEILFTYCSCTLFVKENVNDSDRDVKERWSWEERVILGLGV